MVQVRKSTNKEFSKEIMHRKYTLLLVTLFFKQICWFYINAYRQNPRKDGKVGDAWEVND